MPYSYLILSTAQQEYESSVVWYLERSILAGEQFINAVENTLALICDHPHRWRNEHNEYYELGIKKYPYSIVYRIEENKQLVIISAIYHHKRDPRKKYKH